jgi:hypothetical protein
VQEELGVSDNVSLLMMCRVRIISFFHIKVPYYGNLVALPADSLCEVFFIIILWGIICAAAADHADLSMLT